jgi:hypothetical protein
VPVPQSRRAKSWFAERGNKAFYRCNAIATYTSGMDF